MKTKLAYYRVPFWTCTIDGHHHTTRELAEQCIAKASRQKKIPRTKEEAMLRQLQVSVLVIQGQKLSAAGAQIGIGAARARQLLQTTLRLLRRRGYSAETNDLAEIRADSTRMIANIVSLGKEFGVEVDGGAP